MFEAESTATDQSENGSKKLLKEQIIQNQKNRTLFCVNMDKKCSEEILFELFYQAGPIENLVRKVDRNGKLICLVTYKHLESCEYAIKIFNNILLYNQPLRVQFSQNSSQGQQQQLEQQRNDTVRDGLRLNRNNSSQSLNQNRNQSQIRQEFESHSMIIASPLMNIMINQRGVSPQLPFMPQPAANQFHRSRSGPNINLEFDQMQSNRYIQRTSNNMNQPGQHIASSYNLGSWSNARQRESPHQQMHYSRDRDRERERGRGRGSDSGASRRSRSRSPNMSNKRIRR